MQARNCPAAPGIQPNGGTLAMTYSRVFAALIALAPLCFAQQLVVTAEGSHGSSPPELSRNEISAEINRKSVPIQSWTPLRGELAGLQLYVVIDDGESTDLGIQFGSLKKFIGEQPASTAVGLAYLRNGEALVAAPLSADHRDAADALRLPLGEHGISGSPYVSLSDLIKKWPAAPGVRREVLLISNGMDPYEPADPRNPYLMNAIADAQRAGVLVHSIYYGGSGRLIPRFGGVNWGVNYLSELGQATGGKAYWQGFGSSVLFDSFLSDLNVVLQNQYLLTVAPDEAKGGLEPIHVTTSRQDVSLTAPQKIRLTRPID